MTDARATLIGLDWGSTRVRAYLFLPDGTVVAEVARPWGVLATPGGNFAAAYHDLVGAWRTAAPNIPALACGMIGSSEGWAPAPYCTTPAGPDELAANLVELDAQRDGLIRIVPGVEIRGPVPDVMRGEETQIAGALRLRPELARAATLLLPGTHSKWVDVIGGRITRFTTYLTGELYSVLSEHSILGRPARKAAAQSVAAGTTATRSIAWEAFDRGVAMSREGDASGIAPLLFRTRSLVLQQQLLAAESLDFLSGLLVGDELRSALGRATRPLALVGEPALCERYRRGLDACGVDAPIIEAAAPAGLWHIASRAGLTSAPFSHA